MAIPPPARAVYSHALRTLRQASLAGKRVGTIRNGSVLAGSQRRKVGQRWPARIRPPRAPSKKTDHTSSPVHSLHTDHSSARVRGEK